MTDSSARRKITRILRNLTYEEVADLEYSGPARLRWLKAIALPAKFTDYILRWIRRNQMP